MDGPITGRLKFLIFYFGVKLYAMLRKIIKLLIILIFPFNTVFATDMPIIVIAPSKKAQSVSTVGTSVTVLDETFFKNSKRIFFRSTL